MDTLTRNIVLFSIGSLVFAVSLVLALRRFSKLRIMTRVKVASLIGLIGIASSVYTMTDFIIWIKAIVYSIPLTGILAMLVWLNKEKLYKMPKGAGQLGVVFSLFFWRWLHTVSVELEATFGFTACFTMIFMAFTLDERFFKMESY